MLAFQLLEGELGEAPTTLYVPSETLASEDRGIFEQRLQGIRVRNFSQREGCWSQKAPKTHR